MAIEGRNLTQIGRVHQDRVNHLLAHTITVKPIIATFHGNPPTAMQVSFRDRQDSSAALLHTAFGDMRLTIIQTCDALPVGRHVV
jgi:hypothetical protein